jgi:ABC-2 type transport system ATP-binding protein
VRSPQTHELSTLLAACGFQVRITGATSLRVTGAPAEEIGRLAAREGITLSSLGESGTALEDAFLRLTADGAPPASITPIPADVRQELQA